MVLHGIFCTEGVERCAKSGGERPWFATEEIQNDGNERFVFTTSCFGVKGYQNRQQHPLSGPAISLLSLLASHISAVIASRRSEGRAAVLIINPGPSLLQ